MVVFAAGTGNPYFSTDTAGALRAMEINAQAVLKATKVEGIYDRDPAKHPDATMLKRVAYDHFLANRIGVMDATAVALCRDNKMPIRVFKLGDRGNILRVCRGEGHRHHRVSEPDRRGAELVALRPSLGESSPSRARSR